MPEEVAEKMPIEKFYFAATIAGLAMLGVSVGLLIWMGKPCCDWVSDTKRDIKIGLACCWSLLPSIWFAFENQQIRRHVQQGKSTPEWLECHKLNQDTAKTIWAGISVLILLLLQGLD